MKFLEFNFPDGSVWRVPAHVVAEDRARYYAKHDPTVTYEEEFKFTMDDNYEISDWFFNNMNPEDVEAHAERVKPPVPLTFCEGVLNDESQCLVVDR